MSSDTTTAQAPDFLATVGGTARIGANRELKRAIESYWKGQTDRASLEAVAASLRGETARGLRDAGLDSIPLLAGGLASAALNAPLGVHQPAV